MIDVKRIFAIIMAKMAAKVSRILGKSGGSSLPGLIALKIDPKIIEKLSAQVKEGIIVVSGTNGKTTTTNLIHNTLLAAGKKVICNSAGANMINGVSSAFALAAGIKGNIDADFAIIEADELSTKYIVPRLNPDFMVLTNLFRDQLDRCGEIETIMNVIIEAIKKTEKTKIIYNADDPLISYIALQSEHAYKSFGICEDLNLYQNREREGRFCQVCGVELEYNYHHYGQLGDYKCPECGFSRPTVDYAADNVRLSEISKFRVKDNEITSHLSGVYMVYNLLSALAAAGELGCDIDVFQKAILEYQPDNGRLETIHLSKPVILNLVKNPTGLNQSIELMLSDKRSKSVIIIINDNFNDGLDVSWLWDVDFDRLDGDKNCCKYFACGIRRNDLQVRMKYAGLKSEIFQSTEMALKKALSLDSEVVYVLPNYSALVPTRSIIQRLLKDEVDRK